MLIFITTQKCISHSLAFLKQSSNPFYFPVLFIKVSEAKRGKFQEKQEIDNEEADGDPKVIPDSEAEGEGYDGDEVDWESQWSTQAPSKKSKKAHQQTPTKRQTPSQTSTSQKQTQTPTITNKFLHKLFYDSAEEEPEFSLRVAEREGSVESEGEGDVSSIEAEGNGEKEENGLRREDEREDKNDDEEARCTAENESEGAYEGENEDEDEVMDEETIKTTTDTTNPNQTADAPSVDLDDASQELMFNTQWSQGSKQKLYQ